MAEWVQGRRAVAQKTGFIESEEEMEVELPDELKYFNRYMFTEDDIDPRVIFIEKSIRD